MQWYFYLLQEKDVNVNIFLMYYICNYNLMLYIYSFEEVYYSLKKKGYYKVKFVLYIGDKVFVVDQYCYDVLIFLFYFKNDFLNIDFFKEYKFIFQVNKYLYLLWFLIILFI